MKKRRKAGPVVVRKMTATEKARLQAAAQAAIARFGYDRYGRLVAA